MNNTQHAVGMATAITVSFNSNIHALLRVLSNQLLYNSQLS